MKEFIEKLIGRLKKESGHYECNEAPNGTDADMIFLSEAIKAVERVAEEHNNGWIPCSERYPETNDYILLSFVNFPVPMVGRYEVDAEGGAFYIGDEDETCVSQDIFVNAWMPLPESYQEKENPPTEPIWQNHMMNRFMRGE